MSWNTLVDGITADADEMMENFYHVAQGDLLPRSGSTFSPTSGANDIGSSSYLWARIYVNEIASTITVSGLITMGQGPLVFNVPPVFQSSAFISQRKIVCEHHLPSGNNIGVISGNYNYQTATTLNTVTANNISGATLSSSQITLPAGSYATTFYSPMNAAQGYKSRSILFNVTDSTTAAVGSVIGTSQTGYSVCFFDTFTIYTSTAFELRGTTSYPATSVACSPGNCSFGEPEIYARVFVYQL